MTTLPHPSAGAAHRQASEDGQILVLTVVVALALLAILGLVADGGLVLARHRELQGVADAAARVGAAQLDEASYRASNGRTAFLNPAQAHTAAGRYLRTVRFGGETSITATPGQVTIGLSEMVRPIIFSSVGIGPIRLAVHAVARPRTGIALARTRTMPAARYLTAVAVTLATVLLAGCGGDAESTPPSTTVSAAPSTTTARSTTATTLSAKAELLAAYDRSWDVYADALRRLDPSQLPTVFAGNALKLAQQEVAEHKANGQPSMVRVTHRARVLLVTATDGVVQDHYTNHSVLVDPVTGKPTEPDPNEVVYQRQSLRRTNGVWKVVEVIEERRP